MIRVVRVDLVAARRLLCWYGVFAFLLAPLRSVGLCPFRRLTGRRCPGCGLTSAVSAALRGRILQAGALHPLGLPTAAAVLVSGAMTIVRLVGSGNARRIARAAAIIPG